MHSNSLPRTTVELQTSSTLEARSFVLRTGIFAALALAGYASVAVAAGPLSSVGESDVKFEAVGPAGLKINGASGGIKVSEADGKVRITAPTTSFQTGIGLRDRHLKEYLESEKHPESSLVVDRSAVKLADSGSTSGVTTGQLTLHGVTKPVKVAYKTTKTGAGWSVQGDMDLSIADFQIKKPCYLGVCVDDAVKVYAGFTVHGD